jgi:hypothetical protein
MAVRVQSGIGVYQVLLGFHMNGLNQYSLCDFPKRLGQDIGKLSLQNRVF